MRLEPSDPDIETVITRIKRGDLDLQPDFQRGEVWSKVKKQRLIDSILRDWHIPPIHVIELQETRRQQVLDGQQRLVAIRDFAADGFSIDATIEPADERLLELHGKHFSELSDQWRRRFHQFTLRIFRIIDYRPQEPAELFFRLNQPSSLTAAEQRNAFFGPVRHQIKVLVSEMQEKGLDKRILGFTNARMAYDDLVARLCLTIKRRSLAEKITASDLVDLYRSEDPLDESVLRKLSDGIELLADALPHISGPTTINKATAFSWFMFAIRAQFSFKLDLSGTQFGEYVSWFEATRLFAELEDSDESKLLDRTALAIYDDRATSRVADVSSVILRDAVLWLGFSDFAQNQKRVAKLSVPAQALRGLVSSFLAEDSPQTADAIARTLLKMGWGKLQ